MTLLDAIHALSDAAMLHAIGARALAFAGSWLALWALVIVVLSHDSPPQIWRHHVSGHH